MLKRGHRPQCRRDPAGEFIPREAQIPELSKSGERVELQFSAEAEALEDQGGDIAALVAEDAGPLRAIGDALQRTGAP